MNPVEGTLRKMRTRAGPCVEYVLPVGDVLIDLNLLLGQTVRLDFGGRIFCVACGRQTNRSFNRGYCYPCFQGLAQCDLCIVKPELCHYDRGTCREPAWGETHCMQPHYVYLANSSGVKVGITRRTQIPTRWMDQGATQALLIAYVPSRHRAGLVEVLLKRHVSDRTDWRRMLKGVPEPADLVARRAALFAAGGPELGRASGGRGRVRPTNRRGRALLHLSRAGISGQGPGAQSGQDADGGRPASGHQGPISVAGLRAC